MTDLAHSEQVSASRESSIYRGCELQRAEIELCVGRLAQYAGLLGAAMKTLNQAFEDQNMVGVKLFADNVARAATEAKSAATQAEILARSLHGTFVTHLARRAR